MTEQINLDYRFSRSYEVSVWTLQDEFITVLKWSDRGQKGTIENPQMSIKTDGTQNFSFEIPMSLYIDGVWRQNPIWYNTANGNLIANMRKIKVIFNKKTEDEEVFEFLITKMEMTHTAAKPSCAITCENGLAYHELGKHGYKISLSTYKFLEADSEAFKNGEATLLADDDIIGEYESGLAANLDYWCQEMGLEKAQYDSEIADSRKWYYRVQMDWSSYSNNGTYARESDKIYEEEYVSSWDNDGDPKYIQSYKEKWRQLEESNSNLYNLTQKVAETFGVFCRYKYLYDDNYHIIGRLVIFYNNFFDEKDGVLQFTYPYNTNEVKRIIDSTDIVTKMYIDTIDTDTPIGMLSITNTEANKMQEDYLLNFDYLHEINTITDDQYAAVKEYEIAIREKNSIIIPLQEKIAALEQEKIDVEANQTVADNGRVQAQERLDDIEEQVKALAETDNEKRESGYIRFTKKNPASAGLIPMEGEKSTYTVSGETRNFYYIKLNTKGIVSSSVVLYDRIPTAKDVNQLTSAVVKPNKDGEVTIVKNIKLPYSDEIAPAIIYLTYKYDPGKYYEDLKQTWLTRQAKYVNQYNKATTRLEEIEEEEEEANEILTETLAEKAELIKEFELMLGPALREGHWTPDNYNDYGEEYSQTLKLPLLRKSDGTFPLTTPISHYLTGIWDKESFDGEQLNYYYLGIEQEKIYYPHLNLSTDNWKYVIEQLQHNKLVSIVYRDVAVKNIEEEADDDSHWRDIVLGAGAQIAFVADGRQGENYNRVIPVIIITDAEDMTDEEITYMKQKAILTEMLFTSKEKDGVTVYDYGPDPDHSYSLKNRWLNNADLDIDNAGVITQVFPRLQFHTLDLKDYGMDIIVKYNNTVLENYDDYSLLTRNNSYYLTFNSDSFLINGYTPGPEISSSTSFLRANIDVRYIISNASTSIYLDGTQILKENAYPKVSYEVSPNIINKNMLRRMYAYLNRIININDNELQLHDAYGYISEIELDLDHPWQDSIVVQNYNNKFEDIFSTITAQTESMQRSEYHLNETMNIVTTNKTIDNDVFQNTIKNNTGFTYSFNDKQLTLTEKDGLLGVSDDGQIVIRNNGIFTADTKDSYGNWEWKTAILPSGINANQIRTGQLNTDKILIYSGDEVRFQWNSEGLFAYRSTLDTIDDVYEEKIAALDTTGMTQEEIEDAQDEIYYQVYLAPNNNIDDNQYVLFNSEGLNLIHKNWNLNELSNLVYTSQESVENDDEEETIETIPEGYISLTEYNNIVDNGIQQVEVSWDGFVMRNFKNEKIFFANALTGDLTITGNFSAFGGIIGGWHADEGRLWATQEFSGIEKYVALSTDSQYCILAGSRYPDSAPFYVKYDGSIKATSGLIGGWEISADSLSGQYLQLFGGDVENPGIMTTSQVPNQDRIEVHDNITYHEYQYSYSLNGVTYTGTCFHTDLSLGTASSITKAFSQYYNNEDEDHKFYHYVDNVDFIEPAHTIVKTYTPMIPDSEGVDQPGDPISTIYVAWTELDNVQDEEHPNAVTYESQIATKDPRIMETSEEELIVYDTTLEHANDLSAGWYAKVVALVQSQAYPEIPIDGVNLSFEDTTLDDYVNYSIVTEWTELSLPEDTQFTIISNKYQPTFKIEAKTGKITTNNAKLGPFTLTPEKLADGVLSNTRLDTNTYIMAGSKKQTMETLGQCFYKMSLNSSKGIVTFTRLNGDTVNFKTAALKASGTASAAAGKVSKHELGIEMDENNVVLNNGQVRSYVKTGYGTSSTTRASLAEILTIHSYNSGHFKLQYNDEPEYVNFLRRKRNGDFSSIKIGDGGAYNAGYNQAIYDDNNHSDATTQNATYNINTNKISYTIKTWGNHVKTGEINNITSNKTVYLSNTDNQPKINGSLKILSTTVTFDSTLTFSNSSDNAITITDSTNHSITYTHNKYTAGVNSVTFTGSSFSNISQSQPYSTTLTISISNNSSTSTILTLESIDNNSVKLIDITNTTRATLTHGKYNLGWNTCISSSTAHSTLDVVEDGGYYYLDAGAIDVNSTTIVNGITYYQLTTTPQTYYQLPNIQQ